MNDILKISDNQRVKNTISDGSIQIQKFNTLRNESNMYKRKQTVKIIIIQMIYWSIKNKESSNIINNSKEKRTLTRAEIVEVIIFLYYFYFFILGSG